ncbi:hypothetical protein EMCG_02095, partial [[Emmonsia] crescens]
MSDRALQVWLRAPSETPVSPSINGGLEHPRPPSPPGERIHRGCRNPGVLRDSGSGWGLSTVGPWLTFRSDSWGKVGPGSRCSSA